MEKAPNVFQADVKYRDDLKQSILTMVSQGYILNAHTSFIKKGKTNPHRHINEAIIYWISGKGYVTVQPVGADKETEIEFEPGSVIFVPSFARHGHVVYTDEARYIAITVRGEKAFELYKEALYNDDKTLIDKLGLGVSSLAELREIAAKEENISDRQMWVES
ncbi:cupin domain-containing protein [Chloroflexota bacterium]